jgi:phosphonate transport system substrate-binding protein
MDRITFGMGPAGAGPERSELRLALAQVLADALRMEVRVTAARTYGYLLQQIHADEIHLAWLPPAVSLRARDLYHVTPVAATVRSTPGNYHGVLFVRADAKHREVDHLRGESVAWVDRESCGGYLFPRLALMERGYDPRRFFGAEVLLGSHEAVIGAVAAGEVAAGATFMNLGKDGTGPDGGGISAGWTKVGCEVDMRPIVISREIPNDVICVTRAVNIDFEGRIKERLLAMHADADGRGVLRELLHARRFEPVDVRDYDVVRAAINVSQSRIRPRPAKR